MTSSQRSKTARLIRVGAANRLTQGSLVGKPEDVGLARQIPA
jgi:hypothetical protein